jgi:hypothetical protein
MAAQTDEERIAKKAHELWVAEGRPHGRDREHWDEAREIVALEDSGGVPRLPRNAGADEPVEEKSVAIDNEGEFPNLTDTGEHDLTSTAREPAVTAPSAAARKAAAKPPAAAPKAGSAKAAAPKPVAAGKSSTGKPAEPSKAGSAKPAPASGPKGKAK